MDIANRSPNSVVKIYNCINAAENGPLKTVKYSFYLERGLTKITNYVFARIKNSQIIGHSLCVTANNSMTGLVQLNIFVNEVENITEF